MNAVNVNVLAVFNPKKMTARPGIVIAFDEEPFEHHAPNDADNFEDVEA